jgi:two-component system sensor histidine kinase EvgS
MPGMSGYALAESIRQIEAEQQLRPCPIIGCTANAMSDERQRCEQAGMNHLLVKPVTLGRLAQLLADCTPMQSFDIQTLRNMTQANDSQIHLLLVELEKNLQQEARILRSAVSEHDWIALGASLHRIKGVACLVDAVPLAKACAGLSASVREQSSSLLPEQWHVMEQAIEQLGRDVQAQLRASSD